MQSLADFLANLEGVGEEDLVKLDAMTKGELGKLQGSNLYEPAVKIIARLYSKQTTEEAFANEVRPECPHGYRMAACNRCLRDGRGG